MKSVTLLEGHACAINKWQAVTSGECSIEALIFFLCVCVFFLLILVVREQWMMENGKWDGFGGLTYRQTMWHRCWRCDIFHVSYTLFLNSFIPLRCWIIYMSFIYYWRCMILLTIRWLIAPLFVTFNNCLFHPVPLLICLTTIFPLAFNEFNYSENENKYCSFSYMHWYRQMYQQKKVWKKKIWKQSFMCGHFSFLKGETGQKSSYANEVFIINSRTTNFEYQTQWQCWFRLIFGCTLAKIGKT